MKRPKYKICRLIVVNSSKVTRKPTLHFNSIFSKFRVKLQYRKNSDFFHFSRKQRSPSGFPGWCGISLACLVHDWSGVDLERWAGSWLLWRAGPLWPHWPTWCNLWQGRRSLGRGRPGLYSSVQLSGVQPASQGQVSGTTVGCTREAAGKTV